MGPRRGRREHGEGQGNCRGSETRLGRQGRPGRVKTQGPLQKASGVGKRFAFNGGIMS